MQDRVPLYPGRVTLTPVAGQANTYDMARADQPTQEGTPLNKATLLKDATAAKFGKDASAVPDDVLDVLSKSVLEGTYPVVDVYAGQNWETGIVSGTEDLRAITNITYFVNNVFVVPPFGRNITLGVVSADGKTWTPTQFLGAADNARVRNGMCYKDGIYYLLGWNGNPYVSRIYSSADLKTWTKRAEFKNLKGSGAYLFHSETLKKLIFISSDGDIFMSGDGDVWEQCAFKIPAIDGNSSRGKNGVDEPDGFYIAIGALNARTINVYRLTSNSAELVWQSDPTSSTGTQYFSFIKFKGKYFIYTDQGFHVSDDLKNWQYISGNFNNDGNFTINLDHSETTILSITYDKTVFTSDDGFTFNKSAIDSSYDYGGVVYGNGVFAAQTRPKNNSNFSHFVYTQDTTFTRKPGLVDVLGNIVNIPLKQISGATQCEVGSYVGTGQKQKTIRCSFSPKFFAITAIGDGVFNTPIYYAPLVEQGVTYNFKYLDIQTNNVNVQYVTSITRTADGVNISSSNAISGAFNLSNATYYYVFIG